MLESESDVNYNVNVIIHSLHILIPNITSHFSILFKFNSAIGCPDVDNKIICTAFLLQHFVMWASHVKSTIQLKRMSSGLKFYKDT